MTNYERMALFSSLGALMCRAVEPGSLGSLISCMVLAFCCFAAGLRGMWLWYMEQP